MKNSSYYEHEHGKTLSSTENTIQPTKTTHGESQNIIVVIAEESSWTDNNSFFIVHLQNMCLRLLDITVTVTLIRNIKHDQVMNAAATHAEGKRFHLLEGIK